MMKLDSKVYVAGHTGMVGSAIVRKLRAKGHTNILTRTHQELDLTRQAEVEQFFAIEKPQFVFVSAAKVGGIWANHSYPAEFLYQNLAIQTNIIDAAYRSNVRRLLFLGSSCVYPKHCPQPMQEDHLLTDTLEPTNEPYAIAKIAGIKMCEAYNRQYGTQFLSVMPTNLYGPEDNFDLQTSHVLPALMRKFHEGREKRRSVTVWGTGQAQREFLHVDDCAEACVFLINVGDEDFQGLLRFDAGPLINVGTGEGLTVGALTEMIKNVVGFEGEVHWDHTQPDGTMRKVLDVSRIKSLGWNPLISLEEGMRDTYRWYRESSGHEATGSGHRSAMQ